MNNYRFERLRSPVDYQEVAELIYTTDPYIYSDLFGSIDIAKKVLVCCFDNPASIFFRDFVFIAKNEKNHVLGMSLFHDRTVIWQPEKMIEDFKNAKCLLPDTFFEASSYLESVYNYKKVGIALCNVSVSNRFQRQGVGKFLLTNLLKVDEKKPVELSVLCDNHAAILLYESFGFAILGEAFFDHGGAHRPKVKCFRMFLDR